MLHSAQNVLIECHIEEPNGEPWAGSESTWRPSGEAPHDPENSEPAGPSFGECPQICESAQLLVGYLPCARFVDCAEFLGYPRGQLIQSQPLQIHYTPPDTPSLSICTKSSLWCYRPPCAFNSTMGSQIMVQSSTYVTSSLWLCMCSRPINFSTLVMGQVLCSPRSLRHYCLRLL